MGSVQQVLKRVALPLFAFVAPFVIAATTVGAVAAPAQALPAQAAPATTLPMSVDDFSFDSFHADYRLGRAGDGRSTLETTETITARFPDFDQNRGFIRAIPRVYNGFSTAITNITVTDETGNPRPFDTERVGDFVEVIMAVPEGQYVHGVQTYVLSYEQEYVTAHFTDTKADEFYWDVNGTDSRQPYGVVSATVTLEDGLTAKTNGDVACYRGAFGSSTPCVIESSSDRSFSVAERDLRAGENVSIAIGFESGTFTPTPESLRVEDPDDPLAQLRPPAFLANAFGGIPVFLFAGLATLATAVVMYFRGIKGGRPKTGRAIIAQYDPPEGISAALAAYMVQAGSKAMTSTLLDFAVRRRVRLIHDEPSNMYGMQSFDPTGLLPTERRIYDSIFTANAPAGTVYWFDHTSTRLGNAAAKLKAWARADGRALGYYTKSSAWRAIIPILIVLAAVLLFCLQALAWIGWTGAFIAGVFGFSSSCGRS